MEITTGSTVKFVDNLYPEEKGMIYQIVELNGDRCVIEWVNTTMTIRPTFLAMTAELELI